MATVAAVAGVKAIKQFLETVLRPGGFDRHIQRVQILAGGNGTLTGLLKLEKEDCNSAGTLHGGFSAQLVDNLSSAALATHPSPHICGKDKGMTGVTVQLNVQYMKSVPLGEEILIKCVTDKVGKRLAFLTVDILNHKTGELIVRGTHTKYVGS